MTFRRTAVATLGVPVVTLFIGGAYTIAALESMHTLWLDGGEFEALIEPERVEMTLVWSPHETVTTRSVLFADICCFPRHADVAIRLRRCDMPRDDGFGSIRTVKH